MINKEYNFNLMDNRKVKKIMANKKSQVFFYDQ
jgi:hypothetical protein